MGRGKSQVGLNIYRLLHGKRVRTGFSHELVKYLKSNE